MVQVEMNYQHSIVLCVYWRLASRRICTNVCMGTYLVLRTLVVRNLLKVICMILVITPCISVKAQIT